MIETMQLVHFESAKLLDLEREHELRQQEAPQEARAVLLRQEWAQQQAQ